MNTRKTAYGHTDQFKIALQNTMTVTVDTWHSCGHPVQAYDHKLFFLTLTDPNLVMAI